jgi:hypothetical protein
MVDAPKRVEAAKLIEDFLSCRIINFEYEGVTRVRMTRAVFIYSMVCIL